MTALPTAAMAEEGEIKSVRIGAPYDPVTLDYAELNADPATYLDIMVGEIEIGANLDLTPLISSGGNYFSYQNTDLDTLAGQIGMTRDEEQLKELFRRYGNMIIEDMPFTPLFFRKGDVLSSAKIKNALAPSVSRQFRSVETWSVK